MALPHDEDVYALGCKVRTLDNGPTYAALDACGAALEGASPGVYTGADKTISPGLEQAAIRVNIESGVPKIYGG